MFCVIVKVWPHLDIPIWVPISWTLRMSEILTSGSSLELYKTDGTPVIWVSALAAQRACKECLHAVEPERPKPIIFSFIHSFIHSDTRITFCAK